jgi:hypothetical protein
MCRRMGLVGIDVLPKRLLSQDPYGATSQKTAFFIVTVAETPNPT